MTRAPSPPKRDSYLDQPLSRAGCIGGLLVWAVVMSLPIVVFLLALRGEVSWRRGDFSYDRVFLLNEVDAAGLGYERARVIRDDRPADGPVCVSTRVTYWTIRGKGEPPQSCNCYSATGQSQGACP